MDYSLLPFLFVLLISFVIGCFFSKSSKKQSDYFLAGRTLSWPLLTMTFAATQIGGGFILGTADAAAQDGLFAIFFPLGYSLGFLALGLGFGDKLRSLGLDTASDVFERYYSSTALKKIAATLSIISLTGILIAQAVALKKFLFSLGFSEEWIFLFAWAVVILYTTQGGFLAVVWTDTVQAVVMIGMLIVAFFFTLGSQPDTLSNAAQVSTAKWEIAQPKILGYLLMPFLFTFIEQDMAQRCFAAKSKRDIAIGGCLAALVLFILAVIPVYFGMSAEALAVQGEKTSTFMEVVKLVTNKGIAACAASAVLLAIISTASSLLSAVSSNISQDFTKNKEKLKISTTKLVTLLTGVIALVGSYTATNVLSCMIASYELSVACLFVPFVLAVIFKDKCQGFYSAAILAVIFGAAGFTLVKVASIGMWGELLPVTLSASGFAIGVAYSRVRAQKIEAVTE